jgi:cytochrome c peroxidase
MLLCVGVTAFASQALPEKAPTPEDNPTTPAKVELGRRLYFDKRLSKDGTVSCNSCHNVLKPGGDDGLDVSVGIKGQKGGRNSPTVWNAAFMSVQFWDGRAKTLEEQAKGPMTNPIEMGMESHDAVVARLKKIPDYVKAFEKAFGGKDSVTIDNAAKAIAAYERTLLTPDSPFDRFISGKDKKAISAQAQNGWKLVQEVGCTACHMGPNFAGPPLPFGTALYQKFPVYPAKEYEKYEFEKDGGRYEVTKKEGDKGLWRVPTWRNVARTAPYFHNGKVKTLDEAVRVMAKTQLNKTLEEMQVGEIVAFLKTLDGRLPKEKEPKLPESTEKFF